MSGLPPDILWESSPTRVCFLGLNPCRHEWEPVHTGAQSRTSKDPWRKQSAVGDAIWLPGFDETEVTPMAPQGCFQFERHISFGIILFFVIAEGGDVLALD